MNPTFTRLILPFVLVAGLPAANLAVASEPATPLLPGTPIEVPKSHGGFDFIEVDAQSSRLLAPHTRNGTFDLFSLESGVLEKQIAVGATQDVAVDSEGGKYYLAGSKEPRLIVLDAKSGEITGQTPLPGPADILAFNPKSHSAYVGHDDATDVWVVDVVSNKIVATIPIPEGPEGIVCDPAKDRVYVNVRKTSEIVVIDTGSNQVVGKWSTAPALVPHGLVFDSKLNRLYAAGSGKLAALDASTGKVVATAEIAQKVDQIAFDPQLGRVYCASGTGVMSVIEAKQEGLTTLGSAPTHAGAHSVAVDPLTHSVWTAYGTPEKSFILKLSLPSQPAK